MKERQYHKALRLLTALTHNAVEFRDLLKEANEPLTKEEQDMLQLALIKFIAIVKEFKNEK